ncbi:MAG: radical SAM protein [Proteobacteria bacterium]|nr:radical SAM protein [Pseudomonadota bacterium]MBU4011314.1 radical SAM protein [Pseudomonadota bacterium]
MNTCKSNIEKGKLAGLSFELGPIRPPSEGGSNSLLIRVTRNCPWNRCTFCFGRAYEHEKFQMRTVDDVKADIDNVALISAEINNLSKEASTSGNIKYLAARTLFNRLPLIDNIHQSYFNVLNWLQSGAKTVFLQDADTPVMPTQQLVEIILYLRNKFPTIERVTSYARAKTIYKKKDDEIADLHNAGLSRLHIGLETGDDDLLKKVQKGVTAEEHIIAGKKIKKAGIQLSEYIMPGLGGKIMSTQHAENTARVLNAIDPDFIRSRPFSPLPGTPMLDDYINNKLEILSSHERLKEIKILISDLNVTSRVCFDHFRNPAYYNANGQVFHLLKQDYDGYKFPDEKETVLALIEKGLNISENQFLQTKDFIHLGII